METAALQVGSAGKAVVRRCTLTADGWLTLPWSLLRTAPRWRLHLERWGGQDEAAQRKEFAAAARRGRARRNERGAPTRYPGSPWLLLPLEAEPAKLARKGLEAAALLARPLGCSHLGAPLDSAQLFLQPAAVGAAGAAAAPAERPLLLRCRTCHKRYNPATTVETAVDEESDVARLRVGGGPSAEHVDLVRMGLGAAWQPPWEEECVVRLQPREAGGSNLSNAVRTLSPPSAKGGSRRSFVLNVAGQWVAAGE